MSTIMRSDQTLRLVQLYHNNYPEISKHTQDMEGRRRKMEIWKSITDDLNQDFDTQFTVEQYKKKLQNVQCTSRQKLQTGKRPTDSTTHKFSPAEREFIRLFESSGLRDISPNLFAGIKVEDFINQFSSNITDSTSSTTATSNYESASFNRSGAITPSQNETTDCSPLQQQDFFNQQLLLALGPMLNNSNLLPNLTAIDRNDDDVINNNEQPNHQASPAATSSSSSDFGGIKKVDGIADSIRKDTGAAKRKKRKIDQMLLPSIAQQAVDENDFSGNLAVELVKYQKRILHNQELILEELKQHRPPKNSRLDDQISGLIGAKIDRLCDCLITITEGICRSSPTAISSNGKLSPASE